jgi:iron(III) transport system permease protein
MLSLGRWRIAGLAFIGLWLLLAFVMPIVTLIWVSLLPYLQPPSSKALATLTLQNFAFAPQYLAGPLLNTLAVAGGVIAIALAWSASASWIVTRSRSRFGRWLDVVIFLTPAVPSMAAAVAFQMMGIALNQWVPIYGSVWLIIIAMSTRMLAFCTRTVNASGVQMHAELDEAAYASGISRWVAFRRIFLPIVAPALAYAGLMVGMLVARELTLPLMMDTGRMKLVATLIFDLQTNGSFGAASAVGLYMVVVLVALVLVARRLSGGTAAAGAMTAKRRRPRRWKLWRPGTLDDRLEARQASQGGGNARIHVP